MKHIARIFSLFMLAFMAIALVSCGEDYTKVLSEAGSFIFTQYEGKQGAVTDSFDIANKVMNGQTEVKVTWDLKVAEGGATSADAVKVVTKDGGYSQLYVGYYDGLIDKPTSFTLEPTLSVGKTSKKLTEILGADKGVFKYNVEVFTLGNREQWDGLTGDHKNDIINLKGVVLDVLQDGSSKGSFYFQDAQGYGYYAYLPTDAVKNNKFMVKAGDVVIVTGKRSDYSGQQEFGKGCTFHVCEGQTQEVQVLDATADWSSWKDSKSFTAKYQNNYVKLTGCKPVSSNGSYFYFTVGNGKAEFNVYDSYYFLTEDQRTAFKAAWNEAYANGATLDIEGISTVYSGSIQIYGSTKNAKIIEAKGALSEEEKVTATLKTLEADYTKYLPNEAGELSLPAADRFASIGITWALKEDTTAASIADGKLTWTADVPATLTLVATATSKTDTTKTGSKEIKLMFAKETTTVSEFLTAADKNTVKFLQGVVVAVNAEGKAGSFVLADATGSVFSYNSLDVTLGQEVIIATKYATNGTPAFPQSGTITLVKVVKEANDYRALDQLYETALTKDNLADVIAEDNVETSISTWGGKLIKATGYVLKSGNYINLYKTNEATDANKLANLYMADSVKNALSAEGGLLGQEVDVYGFVRGLTKNGVTIQIQGVVAKDAEYDPTPKDLPAGTYTAQYSGSTTNMAAAPANNAALIGLNANVFTVTSAKKSCSNEIGLNTNGTIRLYNQKTTDADGCELTISVAEGYTITSIKVTLHSGSSANAVLKVLAGTTEVTGTDNVFTINGSTVVIKNASAATSSAQLHIEKIEITVTKA